MKDFRKYYRERSRNRGFIRGVSIASAVVIGLTTHIVSAAQPDLVINISSLPKIAVKNVGNAPSRTQMTTLHCQKISPGSCAESPAMAPYVNPAYPNKVVIKVPALKPGQGYVHTLAFWPALVWRPGKYRFTGRVDDGNNIPESNEANNVMVVIKTLP
ncbi:MAG: hypothetical protein DHS20C01_08510 [marine bacterium B5-7]|nr:MAG: hypothetical protein DHS20C01_08510 [marine bacterium B5-7]